jgi:hypothetical protein
MPGEMQAFRWRNNKSIFGRKFTFILPLVTRSPPLGQLAQSILLAMRFYFTKFKGHLSQLFL